MFSKVDYKMSNKITNYIIYTLAISIPEPISGTNLKKLPTIKKKE